jgi:ABC-type multidrug transport system fused ATPase/permease subunit
MKKKTIFTAVLFILILTSFGSPLLAMEYTCQGKEETELAPKYMAFLAETQRIMHSKEKEVFLQLKNDQDRDNFIESFWRQRGGRQRGVRANINMLRLVRMVQVLDLTEDQVAVIMPAMNKNEEEKQQLQRDLQLHMRDMRLLLRREMPEEQKLNEHLSSIRTLKRTLQEKEAEFDKFLFKNLSLVQQANYIIFSQDFYRGLQEQLNNARRTQQSLQQLRRKKR